jgi:hypothetical protein
MLVTHLALMPPLDDDIFAMYVHGLRAQWSERSYQQCKTCVRGVGVIDCLHPICRHIHMYLHPSARPHLRKAFAHGWSHGISALDPQLAHHAPDTTQ